MGFEIDYLDYALKIFGLLVLGVIVLFLLTWSGIVRCGDIPFWCDAYEAVLGEPRVLIAHGDTGLGEPEALRELLVSPETSSAIAVDMLHMDTLSLGNLKRYNLVIVEKAKKMDIEQLQMFRDYVTKNGGRLVWVGDAGTKKGEGEVITTDNNELNKFLDNPWARAKDEGDEYSTVSFDEFLGLRFVNNYCDEFSCNGGFVVGALKPEITREHHLIYGFSPSLELEINSDRQFSIVKQFPNASNSTIVLNLDQMSTKQGKENSIPQQIPMIATSGFGERIAYYAYPLEYFCLDNNTPNACSLLVKKMYSGMLGK